MRGWNACSESVRVWVDKGGVVLVCMGGGLWGLTIFRTFDVTFRFSVLDLFLSDYFFVISMIRGVC